MNAAAYAQGRFRLFHILACVFAVVAVALRPAAFGHAAGASFNLLVHLPVVLAAAFWLVDRILTRRLTIMRCGIGVPVLVYVLAIALSPVFATYKYAALQFLFIWLTNAALFFLIVNLSGDKRTAVIFLAAFVASMAAAASHGIYQRFGGLEIMRETAAEIGFIEQFPSSIDRELAAERLAGNEPFATFTTSNIFATYLVTALPAAIMWLVCCFSDFKASLVRLIRILPVVLSAACGLACLWYSGSTAGMIVFGIQALMLTAFLAAHFTKGRRGLRVGALIVLLLTAAAGAVFALPKITANKSVQFRFGYWHSSVGIVRNHWVTGVGLENFRWSYNHCKIPAAGEVAYPHNSVIQAFAEFGFIGGISFIAIWIFFLRGLLRRGGGDEKAPPPGGTAGGFHPSTTKFIIAIVPPAMFLMIIAKRFIDGLGADSPAAIMTAAVKSIVWLTVFTILARIISREEGKGKRTYRLLGLGAGVGALGFLLHSLFDFGIYGFATNQAMWIALGCAVALRRPHGSRPLADAKLGPGNQVLLALVAMGAIVFYTAGPLLSAVREDVLTNRAEDLLDNCNSPDSAMLVPRSEIVEISKSVTAESMSVEAHRKVASLLIAAAERRKGGGELLRRAVEVMHNAMELNRNDFALFAETALLIERMQDRFPVRERRYDEALSLWDKAIEYYPNRPLLRVMRANLRDRTGAEADEIIADLEYVRFLLAKNRDANGQVLHKSLELDSSPVIGKANESERDIYFRLCKTYGRCPPLPVPSL